MSYKKKERLITGPFHLFVDEYDLGATTGVVSLVRGVTNFAVIHGQSRTPVQNVKTVEETYLRVTMKSLTLDKLRIIYGIQKQQVDSKIGLIDKTLCFGEQKCNLPEVYSLVLEGPGPGCGCRNLHFPRTIVTPDTIDYTISHSNITQVEVRFTVIPDCEGFLGCITDKCGFISDSYEEFEFEKKEGLIPHKFEPQEYEHIFWFFENAAQPPDIVLDERF